MLNFELDFELRFELIENVLTGLQKWNFLFGGIFLTVLKQMISFLKKFDK